MAKLIYTAIASLDGYVEDRGGGFDWAQPDEEMHAFVWQAADKVVYSRTLTAVTSARTRSSETSIGRRSGS